MHPDQLAAPADIEAEQEPLLPGTKSPWKAVIRCTWAEAREVHPQLALVRVVHVDRKVQIFIPLSPMSHAADLELAGQTLITPAPVDGYTAEERAQILREYDAGPYIPER